MTRLRPALIGVLSSLVLVGCGAETQDTAEPSAAPSSASSPVPSPTTSTMPATSAAQAPISEPPPAADIPEQLRFEAKTVDGETFRGQDLFGSPAVLWFWAPWCPNCQAEAPTIAEVAKTDGVRFVGVAAQDQVPAMQSFVDQYGLGFIPHLADTNAEIWQRFGVTYQPSYAFIGSDGSVEVEKSQLEPEELTARVNALT
jgi:thiol-disulfide isomerase/thioredoxin